MMQYLMSVIETFLAGGVRQDPAGSGTPEEAAAIDVFNAQLIADGQWIFAGGLSSPDAAVVFDNRGDATASVSGPLLTSAPGGDGSGDHYGGFWVVDIADAETARDVAAAASAACNRRIELRPLLGLPD